MKPVVPLSFLYSKCKYVERMTTAVSCCCSPTPEIHIYEAVWRDGSGNWFS